MDKREAELKSAFTQALKLRAPELIVMLYATAGAPDRDITGHGITSFWEFKHGTPSFKRMGMQTLTMMRLAASGSYARFVIWQENPDGSNKRTLIVHPKVIHEYSGSEMEIEDGCLGFDHRWLAEWVCKVHGV